MQRPTGGGARPALLGLAGSALLVVVVLKLWMHPSVAHLGEHSGPIVVLGDSISAGVGSESHRGYVAVLETRSGQKLINKGVPGDTTAQGLKRLKADVLDLKPALVLVELGGNDFLNKVDPAETRANLDNIIAQIQSDGTAVLLIGMQGGVLSDRAADMFRDLASSHHTAFVPNIMAGIFTDPSLKADPIHPNDAGYEKVADKVEPELRWCIQRLKP